MSASIWNAASSSSRANMAGINILDEGAIGDGLTNDTAAVLRAMTKGSRIYIPGGYTFAMNVDQIPSGTLFYGDGETSIITPYDKISRRALGVDSSSSSTFVTGLTFLDLKFLGTVVDDGFYEQAHLLFLSGVKRCRIERCYFEGFRGDGLYIGSGVGGATERHNHDVTVRSCVFDGVNNDNRNGISIIDVDGMIVDDCTFRNCSRSDMPGSIDFEPDQSFGVIKNIWITKNRFYNTDGINAHLTFATQNTVNIGNWFVLDNHFEDAGSKSCIMLNMSSTPPAAPLNMIVRGNAGNNELGNFFYKRSGYCDGVRISGNRSRHLRGVWFAYVVSEDLDTNITIEDNELAAIGAASFNVLFNDEVVNVDIVENNCTAAGNYHISIAGSESSYVSICDNKLIGVPTSGAVLHTSTTKNAITNKFLRNRCDTSHAFNSAQTDFVGGNNPVGADETTLPSAWPYGNSLVRLSSRTIDGASQDGILHTHKNSSATGAMVWQEFMPEYSATYKDDRYFRKSIDASTWDAWWQITGV